MAESQLASARYEQPRLCLRGVPVFVYHGLARSDAIDASSRERKYWLRCELFREHLDQIRSRGYQVRRLGELWNEDTATPWRASTTVLTFDDGLASAYEIAYPLLLEAAVRADFFVNTATIGRPGCLSWAQVGEMQRAGMSFQSHSHDHVYLTWLAKGALEQQVRRSKQMLEDRLGQRVDFLSAPYGDLNSQVVRVSQHEGYKAVCSSWSWPARPGSRVVSRVGIDRHTTPREFRRLLTGSPIGYVPRVARGCLIYVPKRLVLRFRPSPPPLGYVPSSGEK
jgi:peptidoglycan/xylan/chitin deacetylase (PgdA/CDA1 family)